MAKRVVIAKKSGENSAMDRRMDKMHPGMKEGSAKEEAFDKKMMKAKKSRKTSRGK